MATPRNRAREVTQAHLPYGATARSQFLITINTNRAEPEGGSGLADSLRAVLRGRIFEERNIPTMLNFVQGRPRDDSAIKGVDAEFVIEVGSKFHRVHAHVLLDIYHSSRIHVDPTYLRDMVTVQLNRQLVERGLPALRGHVYVNVKAAATGWNMLKYLRKTKR